MYATAVTLQPPPFAVITIFTVCCYYYCCCWFCFCCRCQFMLANMAKPGQLLTFIIIYNFSFAYKFQMRSRMWQQQLSLSAVKVQSATTTLDIACNMHIKNDKKTKSINCIMQKGSARAKRTLDVSANIWNFCIYELAREILLYDSCSCQPAAKCLSMCIYTGVRAKVCISMLLNTWRAHVVSQLLL